MTPGPTIVPASVLTAEGEPAIHHRTKEYGQLFQEFNENLQYVFQTKNPVITFPGAGTGGLEAAVVNFFSPGDKILVVSIGFFGDRFAEIASIFGLDVELLAVPWGQSVDPSNIKTKINENDYKAVLVTHNETSTGACNNIYQISKVLAGKDLLFIVDAVSSLGALDLQTDAWGVDVAITASQKALMSPPGLTFLSVNEKGWEAAKTAKCPKYYWDIIKAKESMEKELPQNPYTPAVSLIRGCNVALNMIKEEGLQRVFKRHTRLARMLQVAVKAIGLEFFAAEKARSQCITSIVMPQGIDGEKVRKRMSNEHNVIIAGGQEKLKGKIIRIGHMGYVYDEDILETIKALEHSLKDEGYPVQLGIGIQEAMKFKECK